MMLELPVKVTAATREGEKIAVDILCDWIEAIALFQTDDELAAPDITDTLVDEEVCESQSEAWKVQGDAWTELKRRQQCIGNGFPLEILKNRITRKTAWRDCASYSFCIVLSLARLFPQWANSFGADYTEQGELFELLTEESLRRLFRDWVVHRTGWSKTMANQLPQVVKQIVDIVKEPAGNVERWTKPRAKEAGLDFLCLRRFADGRGAVPLYLVQCASGRDWENKLDTPNLKVWGKIIDFAATPRRAFATPYSFLESDFPIHANIVDGLFLDRYRLLEASGTAPKWLPEKLERRIIRWIKPRISALPWA